MGLDPGLLSRIGVTRDDGFRSRSVHGTGVRVVLLLPAAGTTAAKRARNALDVAV